MIANPISRGFLKPTTVITGPTSATFILQVPGYGWSLNANRTIITSIGGGDAYYASEDTYLVNTGKYFQMTVTSLNFGSLNIGFPKNGNMPNAPALVSFGSGYFIYAPDSIYITYLVGDVLTISKSGASPSTYVGYFTYTRGVTTLWNKGITSITGDPRDNYVSMTTNTTGYSYSGIIGP